MGHEDKEDIQGRNKVLPSWSPYHRALLHLNEMQASQASDAEWWELCPYFYTQRHTLGLRLLANTLHLPPGKLLKKILQSGEIGLKMELESVGVLVQTEANLEANHREVVGALLYEVTSMWRSSADFSRGVGSAGIRTQVFCGFFLHTSLTIFHQVKIKKVVFSSTSFLCLTKQSLLFARVQSGSCRQPGRDLGKPSCKESAVFLTLFKRPLTPPPFIWTFVLFCRGCFLLRRKLAMSFETDMKYM